jgi:hypothetical protein
MVVDGTSLQGKVWMEWKLGKAILVLYGEGRDIFKRQATVGQPIELHPHHESGRAGAMRTTVPHATATRHGS